MVLSGQLGLDWATSPPEHPRIDNIPPESYGGGRSFELDCIRQWLPLDLGSPPTPLVGEALRRSQPYQVDCKCLPLPSTSGVHNARTIHAWATNTVPSRHRCGPDGCRDPHRWGYFGSIGAQSWSSPESQDEEGARTKRWQCPSTKLLGEISPPHLSRLQG